MGRTDEIVPIFRVVDGRESARWYGRVGFEVLGEHRFAPDLPLYLILGREGVHVHLSEHQGDATVESLAYLWVDDVDSIAAEFGVPVTDQPWARQIEIVDPDGNRLRIGTRRQS